MNAFMAILCTKTGKICTEKSKDIMHLKFKKNALKNDENVFKNKLFKIININ